MQWTLRTRLEAAERERRLAAGLAPDDAGGEAPPERDVIDLRDTRQAALAQAVGAPTPVARVSSELPSRPTLTSLRDLGAASPALPVWQQQGGAPGARPGRRTLTSSIAATLEQAQPRERSVTTTQPTKDRCPQCQGTVRLIRFDLDRAVGEMHCLDCGLQYTAKSPKL